MAASALIRVRQNKDETLAEFAGRMIKFVWLAYQNSELR